MNNGIKTSLLVMTTVLLMALLMPTAMAYDHDQTYDANATYFVLEDVRSSDSGDDRTVEVWINTSVGVTNGLVIFDYDSDCANVTSATINTADWDSTVGVTLLTGETWLSFSEASGSGNSGVTQIGELTIQCNGSSSCCGTVLGWMAGGSALNYVNGIGTPMGPIPGVNWANGTYLCGDGINVTTTVWDGSDWVDELPPRGSEYLGTDVRFNITVTAGCLDLSNVVINDTLDASLAYNNSADPTQDSNTTHTANWTIGTLNAGESNSTEFNATIVGYGTCTIATGTGTVTSLGVEVTDSDDSCVTTLPPAGVGVNKTVWDGTAWVDLITGATIGETYRFRVEVNNTGSPGMDLCEIKVWDELPAGLSYANNAKLWDHYGIEHDINPPCINDSTNNTYGWIIDNWVPGECLQPVYQKIVIEYNVTVTNYGLSCNNVSAVANCSAAVSWVYGNDSACIDVPKPDLNVTAGNSIKVNPDVPYLCDMAFGPTDHVGNRTQSNNISAEVKECNSVDISIPFDVTIVVTNSSNPGVEYANYTTTLPGLAGGTEVTVWCNNSWYPIAGWDYTINVTADPADVIPETDEGNNTLLRDVTPYVYGYKGNSHQDGRNITALQCYEQGTINLTYSLGNSTRGYVNVTGSAEGDYVVDWAGSEFSVIPDAGTTIKNARLYVYYDWAPKENIAENFTLKFNNYILPDDGVYTDMKFPNKPSVCCPVLPDYYQQLGADSNKTVCKTNYEYGMVAYNVTHKFVLGDNTAVLSSSYNKRTPIKGMLLVVVYEHPDEPERIIWVNEGFDLLKAGNIKYTSSPTTYGPSGVTSEEATTYAPFTPFAGAGCDVIPVDELENARLVTVTNDPEYYGGAYTTGPHALYFNGELLGCGHSIWDSPTSGNVGYGIGINETDVVNYIEPTNNFAEFQSYDDGGQKGGDNFEATNAFLILEMAKPWISAEPDSDECYDVGEQFDVLVNLTPLGVPLMGAQFDLHFNASALKAETVTYGDFLMGEGSVFIGTSDIDNANGVVSFAAARQGTSVGVTGPGTFAIVHFTAEAQGMTSDMDLINALASDNATPVNTYELVTHNGTVEVCSNAPPVAVAKSNYTINNIAEKGLSKAYFIGTDSNDLDGTLTNLRWWVDDGSSLVGEIAEHLFVVPMYWQGGSDGYYALANVTLTVTDDGMPLMDANDTMEVIVYIGGDATGDGRVNIADGVTFGMQFGKSGANIGDPDNLCWFGNLEGDKADLNNDGRVNIGDAMLLGTCWGHTAW